MSLDQQVTELREQLAALARRVREVQGLADEQEKPEAVDALSDVLLALNDANAVLADVIV